MRLPMGQSLQEDMDLAMAALDWSHMPAILVLASENALVSLPAASTGQPPQSLDAASSAFFELQEDSEALVPQDWAAALVLHDWAAALVLQDWALALVLQDWAAAFVLHDCWLASWALDLHSWPPAKAAVAVTAITTLAKKNFIMVLLNRSVL